MSLRCAILGAGISGLSTAYFLQAGMPSAAIDIYDAHTRIGGVIKSEKISGCIVEAGPDSFLTMKKSAARLCGALGMGGEMVGSNDQSRKTFIFQEGELKELPDGFFMMVPTKIGPLVTTSLFTWPGKLEALADLFAYPEQEDCTVADFLQRRFGTEVLERIAEPMISGIYGADVERLSLQSALPQIWEMQKKGSMILQLLKRRPAASAAESLFTTLENGMESLVERLQERIFAKWKLGHSIETLSRADHQWVIEDQMYDVVILAGSGLPIIHMESFAELERLWNDIQKNSAIVTVMAFRGIQKHGFGWLVPASERRSILAATYVSNKFPRRSPADLFLVRTFIGGDQAAKWIERSDQEILTEVLSELKRIAGIQATTEFHRIFRWHDAMPEYQVGHRKKMERIQNLIRLNEGLYVTGNVFSGVGVPDCIQHAEAVAAEIMKTHR